MPKKQAKLKLGLVTESNAKYHGDLSAISKSRLAYFSVCPAYYKWKMENPEPPSDDLVVGSAFHKLCLEEKQFDKEFVVMPPIDKRTKAGKEAYEAFVQQADGRQVITQEQYDTICGMRDSVMSNPYAVQLLKGKHEKSMYGFDELTNERIKTRPDTYREIMVDNDEKGVAEKRVLITDLKSCRSAMYEDFCRDVVKYSYDLQAYLYSMNASKVLNVPIENIDFVFIAVQKSQPYLINILQADEFVLQRGEALFRRYIGEYHEAKTTDNWWGLNGQQGIINNLSLPSYLLKNIGE